MNMHTLSAKIVVRYILIQLLGVAAFAIFLVFISRWVDIPAWLMVVLIALWVIKDIALFPFVWKAYDWDNARNKNPMIGMRGHARQDLNPQGYVEVRGELWQAELTDSSCFVEKGETVFVVDMRGLTLLVEPDNQKNRP